MHILSRIINFGVKDFFSNDEKSDYRRVNGILITFAVISFLSSIYPCITGNYIHGIIQIFSGLSFLFGYHFISKNKIRTAKLFTIFLFELIAFAVSMFLLLPNNNLISLHYSPTFMFVALFPLLAANFGLNIIIHAFIGVVQIALIQIVHFFNFGFLFQELPANTASTSLIIVNLYVVIITSVLVFFIFRENKRLKKIENKYASDLELALENLNKSVNELQDNKKVLQEQSTELNELNSTKNRLFSIIAHDLRSPLNAILGFTELMLHKNFNEEKKNFFLAELNKTARSTFELLDNLLQWARSQSNRIEFNPKSIFLKQLVEDCIQTYQTQIDSKNINIENLIEDQQIIFGDYNMLGTIIRNMLNNAVKYSHPNSEVLIFAKHEDEIITVSIQDFGVGMDEKTKDKIFNFVYNASLPGTNNELGTGIGLQLCKEFIEKHNGTIKVESHKDEGSIFSFSLPLL